MSNFIVARRSLLLGSVMVEPSISLSSTLSFILARVASGSTVCTHRTAGELLIDLICASPNSSAIARACRSPSSVSGLRWSGLVHFSRLLALACRMSRIVCMA